MQKTIDSQHATICQINRASQCQLKEIRDLKCKLKKRDEELAEAGADAFMDLHSIIETTKKHGNSPYNAILALF